MLNKILLQSIFITIIILVISSCTADEKLKLDCSKITNMSVYCYDFNEFEQGYDDSVLINKFCNIVNNSSQPYRIQSPKIHVKYRFNVNLFEKDSLAYCLPILFIEKDGAFLERNSKCSEGWFLGFQRNNDFIPFFEKLLKDEDTSFKLKPLNITYP